MSGNSSIRVSSEIATSLVDVIKCVPEREVVAFGTHFLTGGFTKAPAIRSRLESMIKSDAPIPERLVSVLRDWMPEVRGFDCLTPEAVRALLAELTASHRPSVLESRLCLVERAEIRGLAHGQDNLQNSLAKETSSKAKSVSAGLAGLASFIIQSKAEGEKHNTPRRAHASSQDEELRRAWEEIHGLKGKLEKARGTHSETIRRQRDEYQRKLAEAAHNNERLVQQLGVAHAEHEEIRGELAALREHVAEEIRRGVDFETSVIRNKWLSEPMDTDFFVAATGPDVGELLDRVNQALVAQAYHDRHTGNRRQLREWLGNLEQAERSILEASTSALHPLAELETLRLEVSRQMQRIRKRLELNQPESPVSARIAALLNRATDSQAFGRVPQSARGYLCHRCSE